MSTEHLDRYQMLVKSTCESIREGRFANPAHIVEGIKQEIETCMQWKWWTQEQREEMEKWMNEALSDHSSQLQ